MRPNKETPNKENQITAVALRNLPPESLSESLLGSKETGTTSTLRCLLVVFQYYKNPKKHPLEGLGRGGIVG